MDRDEYYTVPEAAKVLDKGERWIRKLASEGVLEGDRTESGWKLFRRSVHDFRDTQRTNRGRHEVRGWPQEALEWIEKANALQRELGRLEGRLELTEQAQSTIREERDRLLKERDETHEEAKRLREELDSRRRRALASEQAKKLEERSLWRRTPALLIALLFGVLAAWFVSLVVALNLLTS